MEGCRGGGGHIRSCGGSSPERGRQQLAIEGAEGDHGKLFLNVTRRDVLPRRQTCRHTLASAPAGDGGGWAAGDGGVAPGGVPAVDGRLAGASYAICQYDKVPKR